MDLINRKDAIKAIDDVLIEDDRDKVWFKLSIKNLESVEAIPIEFIRKAIEAYGKDAEEYHKKGQYIMGITALEKNIALSHLIEEWFKERKK